MLSNVKLEMWPVPTAYSVQQHILLKMMWNYSNCHSTTLRYHTYNYLHWTRVRPIPVSGIGRYSLISVSIGYLPIIILASAPIPVVMSFICLFQHRSMHAYSFKPRVGLILRNRFLQHCWQQQVGRGSARLKVAAAAGPSLHSDPN